MNRLSLLLLLLLLSSFATAQITSLQNPLPREAQEALEQARDTAAEALEVYSSYHPDQPLFREAIRLGKEAVELAPKNPETLRFLAELYGVTDFYGPAFRTWLAYLQAGGTLDADARAQLSRNGNSLGYARYTQGNLLGALTAYRAVAEAAPRNERALRWSGRILLELDLPEDALPYWQKLLTLRPNDEGAAYFRELAQAGNAYGIQAARTFYSGVTAYEAGRKEVARRRFTQTTALNPDYAEAWGYQGRIAFEAQQFTRAERAYARASRLEPTNQTYSYFLRQASERVEGANGAE